MGSITTEIAKMLEAGKHYVLVSTCFALVLSTL